MEKENNNDNQNTNQVPTLTEEQLKRLLEARAKGLKKLKLLKETEKFKN